MLYRSTVDKEVYMLNLIGTSGHIDFSYEVNWSVVTCEGALLAVDINEGSKAQVRGGRH